MSGPKLFSRGSQNRAGGPNEAAVSDVPNRHHLFSGGS